MVMNAVGWRFARSTNATPTTTTTDQLRISTGGVHNAAIIATCVRAHNKGRAQKELELRALTHVAMIAALCTPLVLILSWSVVVVGVSFAAASQTQTISKESGYLP